MSLSNSQYQTIMREYNRKQLANRRRQQERIGQVRKKLPQYQALEEEIGLLALEQAKKLLAGDRSALEELKKQIGDRREQKEILLLSKGFPPDYLDMDYSCQDCQDTGYIGMTGNRKWESQAPMTI